VSDTARQWPAASLSPIRRARVIGSSIPSAAWAEGILDAPYEVAWRWVSDLENSVPRFDTQVHRLQIHERWAEGGAEEGAEERAERLRLTATTFGVPVPFDVRLEDGYCLMQARARLYLVLMAAEPHDDGARTRFFHLEALPLPGTRPMRRHLQRAVDEDLANLTRIAAGGF